VARNHYAESVPCRFRIMAVHVYAQVISLRALTRKKMIKHNQIKLGNFWQHTLKFGHVDIFLYISQSVPNYIPLFLL